PLVDVGAVLPEQRDRRGPRCGKRCGGPAETRTHTQRGTRPLRPSVICSPIVQVRSTSSVLRGTTPDNPRSPFVKPTKLLTLSPPRWDARSSVDLGGVQW